MTLKEIAEAAAVYAPALALLGLILRLLAKWLLRQHRQIIKEEQEPLKTQTTGIETKVDRAIARLEVMNGSVAMVVNRAEQIDQRVLALENIEKGKEIARAEMAAAAQIVKEKKE